MIHKNKRYALLGALVISAGIFGAVLFSGKGTGSQTTAPALTRQEVPGEPVPTGDAQAIKANPQQADSKVPVNGTNTAAAQYLSTQKEGIIGSYAGKQLDNPADNIFTVGINGELSDKDIVWLSYELEGVSDYTGIPVSVNDRPATGGYLVKLSDKASLQRQQVDAAWLKKGDNRIQFSLPENAAYGYKVSNLSVEIEKGTDTSPLVVNATGVSYDNKAYISAFIREKDISGARFYVDGKEVTARDGEFEAIVPVGDSRKVSVKAVLPGGRELQKEIAFTKGDTADIEYAMDNNTRRDSKTFRKGQAGEIQFETALLKVESSALLAASKDITISTLRHIDIPALDMGMSNVTAGHKGYRFLPHGEHFTQGATVTIKYDRTKIPSGFTEDDIKTYYFDLDTRHWVALERDTIDKANQLVVSTTTHFTDMINGVIQTPESPETQGFAPTMMNDIKAADPTAKVQLIAPPAANNRGSAGLSYGFEMPPARNGMQPSLGIQYNSDGGSGWLGEGWDLSTPSISVDTRWGVPRWDDSMETETYSFNGSMLVTMDDSGQSSVAHRGDKISRKADRQFYPRNEGSFSKIIRKGSSPANYTWEVTDKSGTKYIYGAVLKGSAKTLGGNKEVVVEWKLSRVEELHGDYIEYIYETADEPVRGSLTAKAIYLKEVRAGNKGNDPHTVVTLTSTTQKDKKNNGARYGFLTSSNKLLDKVDIAFEGETLRSYTFEYKPGAFNTNILTRINHIDSKGDVFASHDMDYYDDVKSTEGYKPFENTAETWNLHDDGIDAGFINPVANLGVPGFSDKTSALGGSKTTSSTYSGYVGIGPYDVDLLSKSNTGGFSYGHTSATSYGLSELVDINGDGLPDKVYVDGGSVYYRPNLTKGTGAEVSYGEPVRVKGISQFSKSSRRTNAYGLKGHAGFGDALVTTGIDYSHTNTEVSIYFTDANNDGLIDLVIDGKIYFNHIEFDGQGNAIPTFTLSSGDTPSPINGGGVVDTSDTQVDPQEQAEMIRLSPLQDVVRVWEAPFDGTIKIEGDVQLQIPTGDYDTGAYEKADGVRIAIQIGGNEKFSKVINKGDASVYQAMVGNTPVQKGQRVYFRVQSGNTQMANGAFDIVKWDQTVTYTDRVNTTNPDGQGSYVYKSGEADFISSGTLNYILSDSIRVTGTFVKPITSDNLILKAVSVNGDTQSTLYQREFRWDETYDGELSFDIENNLADAGLQLRIEAQTNIAFDKVKWEASLSYNNNGADINIPATVYYTVHATHVLEGIPYALSQDAYVRVRPQFTSKPLMVLPDSKFIMSVKNVTGLLAEKEITFANGIYSPAAIDSIDAKAGNIWVEYYSEDKDFLAKTDSAKVTLTAFKRSLTDTKTMKVNVFTARGQDLFGMMYRGWGQFVYNAAEGRYASPIDESLLKLPENEEQANPLTMPLVMMTPDAMTKAYWTGQNPNTFINGNMMGSSRLGEQDVVLTNPLENMGEPGNVTGECITGSGRNAISMKSKSESIVNMAGASGPIGGTGVSGTLSAATGWEKNLNAFIDMNGDGYPDIVTENQIQLTNTLGGMDGEIVKGVYTSYNSNDGITVAAGGSPGYSFSMPVLKGSSGAVKMINQAVKAINGATANVSGNGSVNHDYTDYTLVDVNGDGLPDKVLSDKRVQLNFGYGFSEPLDWDLTRAREITSNTFDIGGDASKIFGIDRASSSFSAGFGLSTTFSKTDYNLLDINADGLPDKVRKDGDRVYVSLNTGNGFTPEIVWNGLEDK